MYTFSSFIIKKVLEDKKYIMANII